MGQTWTAAALRASFDEPRALTVGLEEEVFLLDLETLDLAPVAALALGRLRERPDVKLELPAAQIELVTAPARRVADAIAALGETRRALAEGTRGLAAPAATAVHPFADVEGLLNGGERYAALEREYASVARRQLVASLHVHVAIGDAERALAIHNALRCYLPELAALAANGPIYAGRDSGLASVRPTIGENLPRQGLPPEISSWEAFAAELRWAAAAGIPRLPSSWWWELRPNARVGTIELRVPDAQTTLAEAGAVAATAHCLVAWLCARHVGGEPLPTAPAWRIGENRWSACRHGVEGAMADLETGRRAPTRERLHALLDALVPVARELDCAGELRAARVLVDENGAARQRARFAAAGPVELARWLTRRFLG